MAISRVKVWSNQEVLTSDELNNEFNNPIDNALALISPLTGNLSGGGNQITAAIFVPAAVSGIPVQHALYRENVIKGWIQFNGTGTPAINDSFNVSGTITDNGAGDYTFSWDRDFANVTYAIGGFAQDTASGGLYVSGLAGTPPAAGTLRVQIRDAGAVLTDASVVCVIAVGDQ